VREWGVALGGQGRCFCAPHKAGQLQRDYAEPYADLSVGLIPGVRRVGWERVAMEMLQTGFLAGAGDGVP